MTRMSVTLEVSKLGDWLNADAYCQESNGGHTVRGEGAGLEAGGRRVTAVHAARRGRARLQIEGRARGGAHEEHVGHACDAGGVEAQRLVERRRELPRVKRRACGAGRGIRVGGQQTAAHAACRRGLDCRLEAGHGEERTLNMLAMVVTLEVSKLSGWLNAYADCRGSKGGHTVRGEVRVGRRQAVNDRGARAACRGEGTTADWGQGTGRSAPRTWRAWS
eukprot:scaffold10238_cov45-Phaeocystis_antarctica.AAC.2